MSSFEVEIREIPPMYVVAARATSSTPEQDACAQLLPWAESAGLLDDPGAHPVFGYNNPPPEPGELSYGYELWIKVDDRAEPPEGMQLHKYPGGRFAVIRCRLHGDSLGMVPEVWRQLVSWVQESHYAWRPTHELERLCNPGAPEEELELELHLPIQG